MVRVTPPEIQCFMSALGFTTLFVVVIILFIFFITLFTLAYSHSSSSLVVNTSLVVDQWMESA